MGEHNDADIKETNRPTPDLFIVANTGSDRDMKYGKHKQGLGRHRARLHPTVTLNAPVRILFSGVSRISISGDTGIAAC